MKGKASVDRKGGRGRRRKRKRKRKREKRKEKREKTHEKGTRMRAISTMRGKTRTQMGGKKKGKTRGEREPPPNKLQNT